MPTFMENAHFIRNVNENEKLNAPTFCFMAFLLWILFVEERKWGREEEWKYGYTSIKQILKSVREISEKKEYEVEIDFSKMW